MIFGSMFKIEVPVTPVVKKWIVQKHGEIPQLTTKNSLGITLTYMIHMHNTRQDKSVNMATYSERIVIKLTADIFFRYGFTLTPTAVCHFNKYVLEEIYSLMFYGIDLECERTPTRLIKDCIENFCDRYDFQEDIFSYERAKKAYYRYRNSQNVVTTGIKKNRAELSPI
jgi:hypothetical protein